jgi:hypothetical protein
VSFQFSSFSFIRSFNCLSSDSNLPFYSKRCDSLSPVWFPPLCCILPPFEFTKNLSQKFRNARRIREKEIERFLLWRYTGNLTS